MKKAHLKMTALREKCPNKEFVLVHILPHSDWMRRDISYRVRTESGEIRSISLYAFRMRKNTYQEKRGIWTLFTQCHFSLWTMIIMLQTHSLTTNKNHLTSLFLTFLAQILTFFGSKLIFLVLNLIVCNYLKSFRH